MERYKVKEEYKRRSVSPRYVHLVCGTGKYTNFKAAETLAKRSAGIDTLYTNKILSIENSQFEILDREEFLQKLTPGVEVYLYGSQETVEDRPGSLCGSVSAITSDKWGGIEHSIRQSNNVEKSVLSNTRQLVVEYESKVKDTAPPSVCKSCEISVQDLGCYSIIVGALIIEWDGNEFS